MFYEKFAESYDDMINWAARLEVEQEDLKKILRENGVKVILDAGCGTGIHDVVFSKFGLNVTGVDNNPSMLDIARKNAQRYGVSNINFVPGEFTKLDKVVKGPFDCVTCLGNSLPHLVEDTDIIKALKQFYALLKPGGICLLQTVHFDHYLDTADSAVAVSEGQRFGQDVIFRRHYEFKGTKVIFHVSVYDNIRRELQEDFSSPLNAIRKDLLMNFMEKVGFDDLEIWSDFARKPITDTDRSLVIFARKSA